MNAHLECNADDCPYDGQPEDHRRNWHINKGVDLGQLLLTLTLASGFIVWAMAQERRLTTVENGVAYEHSINMQQDASRDRAADQTSDRLQRIEDKIDRLSGVADLNPAYRGKAVRP